MYHSHVRPGLPFFRDAARVVPHPRRGATFFRETTVSWRREPVLTQGASKEYNEATQLVVPEVLRKSGSARCREDNFSRLIA